MSDPENVNIYLSNKASEQQPSQPQVQPPQGQYPLQDQNVPLGSNQPQGPYAQGLQGPNPSKSPPPLQGQTPLQVQYPQQVQNPSQFTQTSQDPQGFYPMLPPGFRSCECLPPERKKKCPHFLTRLKRKHPKTTQGTNKQQALYVNSLRSTSSKILNKLQRKKTPSPQGQPSPGPQTQQKSTDVETGHKKGRWQKPSILRKLQDRLKQQKPQGPAKMYLGFAGIVPKYFPPGKDNKDRAAFMKLVHLHVLTMTAVTCAMIFFVVLSASLREFFLGRFILLFIILSILEIIAVYFVVQNWAHARTPPCDSYVWILTNINYTFLAAVVAAHHKPLTVLWAIVATIAMYIGLYKTANKCDYMNRHIFYISVAGAVFLLSIIMLFVYGISTKPIFFLLFCAMLLRAAMFIGLGIPAFLGTGSMLFQQEEYAYGVYRLYSVIIEIFMFSVLIIGVVIE